MWARRFGYLGVNLSQLTRATPGRLKFRVLFGEAEPPPPPTATTERIIATLAQTINSALPPQPLHRTGLTT